MHASVKVLDIDIDMMTNDVFVQKMNEYLSDDKLDVILFASTELLDKAMGEESYREVIEQADLILPGEEALLSAHHVEVLEAGGMVVSCRSFGIMLENLQKKDQSVYIIGKSSTEVEQLETWCKRMQPGLRLSGSVVYDPDMEAAALINEINNHTPDILLVDLETGPQEIWIMEHLPLLHARLCVAIGGVVSLILAEEKKRRSGSRNFIWNRCMRNWFASNRSKKMFKHVYFERKLCNIIINQMKKIFEVREDNQ